MRYRIISIAALLFLALGFSTASAADFRATQFRYLSTDGKGSVLLTWLSDFPEPVQVSILVDDVVKAESDAVLGKNSFELADEAIGLHTYEVRGAAGSFGSQAQEVLSAMPTLLETPKDLLCEAQEQNGRCEVSISWSAADAESEYYDVLVDGAFQIATDGPTPTELVVAGTTSGQHCVQVGGAVRFDSFELSGRYRGPSAETCCDVPCGAEPCPTPQDFSVAQVKFGPGEQDNAILLRWQPPKPYGIGIRLFRNGAEVAVLPGSADSGIIEDLAPGRAFEVAARGDCGPPSGLSGRAFDLITLLPETPHKNPVSGVPVCSWSPDGGGATTVTWTLLGESVFLDVYVERGGARSFVERLGGTESSAVIQGTLETDAIELQFFAELDGGRYGSIPITISCGTGAPKRFVRGVCNGVGERPNITSAVFGLNYLFLGGGTPPCAQACYLNGDAKLDLSDMVYLLNFLFLGGLPPPEWGGTEPICELASPGDDCSQGNESCPP